MHPHCQHGQPVAADQNKNCTKRKITGILILFVRFNATDSCLCNKYLFLFKNISFTVHGGQRPAKKRSTSEEANRVFVIRNGDNQESAEQ